MSLQLSNNNDFEIALSQVSTIDKLAILMSKNPHYQKMGMDGVYAILFAAQSTKVDPFQALNGGFYYARGKVGMSTELQVALIRRAGHKIWKDPSSTADKIIISGQRSDSGDVWTCEFSMKDAATAGLINQDTWKKYPTTMCYNRAMGLLARQLFADVVKGYAYDADELREIGESKEKKELDSNKKIVPLETFPAIDIDPIVEITESKIQKPIFAKKENVEKLIYLVSLCGSEYEENFYKLLNNEGVIDPLEMPISVFNGHLIITKEHMKIKNISIPTKLPKDEVPF